jgi:hypothetical protein
MLRLRLAGGLYSAFMGAQVARQRRAVSGRGSDPVSPLLRRIWLELIVGQLVLWSLYGGCAYAAVVYGPQLLKIDTGQGVAVPARLPEGWPQPEVRLPAGAVRSELPAEYCNLRGPRFAIAGERWSDPLNWGSYPELWMVAFRCDSVPQAVFNEMMAPLSEPLYKLIDASQTREASQYVYQYCDGDTLVYLNGPGVYGDTRYYTIRVLLYDH